MTARSVIINPACRINRIRKLPTAGRVLVNNGQSVTTNDVIAEIQIPEKHQELDVANALGLSVQNAVRKIHIKPGDLVHTGDVIAHKGGLITKSVTSPVDGRVVDISSARVLIEYGSQSINVKAGFSGLVKEVIPGYGAIVSTAGALLQGVWGNGRVAEGLMICLARDRVDELSPEWMDMSLRGSIVFGGPCLRMDTLRRAAEISLRGLIVSGIEPDLLTQAGNMPFPIISLVGLGRATYDEHTFKIISSMEKCVACVNACTWNHCSGSRPEVIIPTLDKTHNTELMEDVEYQVGQLVRILQSPYLWETARIKKLIRDARLYPGGIVAQSAICVLENGEEIVQPLVNLEVIL
ncbi:MAG: hypothetical protein JXR32_05670 [Anaerolineaceae bacterium]|nr:hypothetical protein [Anaerolineaceae bacterium]